MNDLDMYSFQRN